MIEQLHDLLQKIEYVWPGKRVLVVGDVMLDKYIGGEVQRISPEAPVPVLLAQSETHQPGGAANVALNISSLGAQCLVVGFVGLDENAKLLASSLSAKGVSTRFVTCGDFPTVTKTRIVGGRQQMLRLDVERLTERPADDCSRLVETALSQLRECDAVVISDYAKGSVTPQVCQQIIHEARKREIPVLVDPKSPDFSRYRGATTICPNLSELSKALGREAVELDALFDLAESKVSELDLEFLTATLSEKGIALLRPGNRFIAPAAAREVFDVSGAGDTVIAVMALCLSSGLKAETACEVANLAAGIVVGKVGTVPVEKFELMKALAPEIALHSTDKVLTPLELASRVASWKANGEHVVFTNGCFDLLHIGHITVLEQARRFGDRLIVAINSDASVSRLKGPSRPIVGEADRARVLAALASVDAVVVFDAPTPLEIIVSTRPDVIVKGGDYSKESIVGAREVEAWGGRVEIVPIVEGFSTTRLIARTATQ